MDNMCKDMACDLKEMLRKPCNIIESDINVVKVIKKLMSGQVFYSACTFQPQQQ